MRLRGLFIRIFLWFWLAMALVSLGIFLSIFLTERNQRIPPWRGTHIALLGVYAQTAAETFERDGREALAAYLERIESISQVRAVLFNESGEEISGRAVPPGAREIAEKAAASDSAQFAPPTHEELGALAVRTPRGNRFTLAAIIPIAPPPFRPPFGFNFARLALQILAVLVIGGLLCYLLARYLTAPVIKLRETTQELSSGNLDARVRSDITGRKDEIGGLGGDFNIMAERIESLVTAQRRLLGDISHELRSPLARLGVALELARRRASPEAGPALDRIEREAQSINEMIGQLLTLSRVEVGTHRLNNVKLDLCALLQAIAEDADFEARSRNRSVSIRGCEDCAMVGVAELLRSAIENVVRNAVRYTAEGTQVEITLRRENVEGGREAVIRVRDHGAGVPEEAIDEIFRPFYRVEDARDRQTGGTGLGLAIAARAVRLHGGTIKAMNESGGGLVVEMRFPIKE